MRSKSFLPVILAALLTAATSPAQTISYINFLQFDLQSFRSQATAGIFQDDVDLVADAANLTSIEGNRIFTNFANLNDPATLGDNILTYSLDDSAAPTHGDHFDTGSYLVGWIGKYSQDSDYSFSTFYQRNSSKTMFEDLEDLNLGFVGDFGFDAQLSGTRRTTVRDDSTGAIIADQLTTFDLERYDERNAMNFDLGAARDLSEEMSLGGRFFWENDKLDSFASGKVEVQNRTIDSTGAITVNSRDVQEWSGNGEGAFQNREIGVSLDVDYHPWENQDLNIRVDVFGSKLVNPSSGLSEPSSRGWYYYDDPIGSRINLLTTTEYDRVAAGSGNPGGTPLVSAHENTQFWTSSYSPYPESWWARGGSSSAISEVDDERTGIGFAAKGQWDREWAGGENRAWVGFGRRSLDVDAKVVEIERQGSTFWWNTGAGDRMATVTDLDATLTTTRKGDMNLNVLEVGTRWNRELNPHVSMGLGGIVTRETWKEDYRQVENIREVFDAFDDGDANANALYSTTSNPAHNEERTLFEEINTLDIVDEIRTTFVRLPVGAQFHFRDRWTVNVGAQHTIANMERETAFEVPAAGNAPGKETYTDVGGAGSVPSPNPEYDTSEFEADGTLTDKERSNWTTYWYGLSVMITDAAQLDINGIFDTHSSDDEQESGSPDFSDSGQIFDVDFFRNLAISLKFIFW